MLRCTFHTWKSLRDHYIICNDICSLWYRNSVTYSRLLRRCAHCTTNTFASKEVTPPALFNILSVHCSLYNMLEADDDYPDSSEENIHDTCSLPQQQSVSSYVHHPPSTTQTTTKSGTKRKRAPWANPSKAVQWTTEMVSLSFLCFANNSSPSNLNVRIIYCTRQSIFTQRTGWEPQHMLAMVWRRINADIVGLYILTQQLICWSGERGQKKRFQLFLFCGLNAW